MVDTSIHEYPIADSIGFSSRRGVKVLSNMDKSCPLTYEGEQYNSVEQLFHVLIYRLMEKLAKQCANGKEVKRLNSLYMENRDYRWDSNEVRKQKREQMYRDMYDLLHICHRVKFECNKEFRKVILESGDKYLVEDCHWLDGTRKRSDLYGTRRNEKKGIFIGKNINGQSLMALREEVREAVKAEVEEVKTSMPTEPLNDSDYLTERKKMAIKTYEDKKVNLFIQRVECCAYDKLGFCQYHYIDKPINKAAMAFLVTASDGQPLGFLGFLNHTFRGCSNGLMVSRYVILPQYQKRGYAVPILSCVCGMLKSKGYRVFINTEKDSLGERLMQSSDFRATTFNCAHRVIKASDRYKHRRSGTAYRLEYYGRGVNGYEWMLSRVAVLRQHKGVKQPHREQEQCAKPMHYWYFSTSGGYVVTQYVSAMSPSSDNSCGQGDASFSIVYDMPQCSARGTPLMMQLIF